MKSEGRRWTRLRVMAEGLRGVEWGWPCGWAWGGGLMDWLPYMRWSVVAGRPPSERSRASVWVPRGAQQQPTWFMRVP